jgi:hypothetical protein
MLFRLSCRIYTLTYVHLFILFTSDCVNTIYSRTYLINLYRILIKRRSLNNFPLTSFVTFVQ